MKVLITGVTGFVGSHLAKYLTAQGLKLQWPRAVPWCASRTTGDILRQM